MELSTACEHVLKNYLYLIETRCLTIPVGISRKRNIEVRKSAEIVCFCVSRGFPIHAPRKPDNRISLGTQLPNIYICIYIYIYFNLPLFLFTLPSAFFIISLSVSLICSPFLLLHSYLFIVSSALFILILYLCALQLMGFGFRVQGF